MFPEEHTTFRSEPIGLCILSWAESFLSGLARTNGVLLGKFPAGGLKWGVNS